LRREAVRAALERPLGEPTRAEPGKPGRDRSEPAAPAASLKSDFRTDDDAEAKEIPTVPSIAVLRSRRTDSGGTRVSERSQLPSWDDVLFGGK
jgi:hypothetical protein